MISDINDLEVRPWADSAPLLQASTYLVEESDLKSSEFFEVDVVKAERHLARDALQ